MLKTKNTILLVIILFSALIISAQTTFSLKTGLNFSKAKYLNEYDEDLIAPHRKLKTGFNAGFILNYQMNKIISVQAEILYSQKGLKVDQLGFGTSKIAMNYVELPVSGRYSIYLSKRNVFDIYLGGFGAFWTDGKSILTDNISGETVKTKIDFRNENFKYNRIDAGIIGGFSVKLQRVTFDIRYTHGMLSSSQEVADAITNNLISVSACFILKE